MIAAWGIGRIRASAALDACGPLLWANSLQWLANGRWPCFGVAHGELMRRTYQVAALLLAIGADTSLAQPRVDAARVPIELRASEWLSDGARILLFSAGSEHVLSRVTIQWIAPPEPGAQPLVISTRYVEIGMSSCDNLRRVSEVRFSIECAEVHGPNEGVSSTYLVQIGPVGEYSIVRQTPDSNPRK